MTVASATHRSGGWGPQFGRSLKRNRVHKKWQTVWSDSIFIYEQLPGRILVESGRNGGLPTGPLVPDGTPCNSDSIFTVVVGRIFYVIQTCVAI